MSHRTQTFAQPLNGSHVHGFQSAFSAGKSAGWLCESATTGHHKLTETLRTIDLLL
jgi:hypothetical protein